MDVIRRFRRKGFEVEVVLDATGQDEIYLITEQGSDEAPYECFSLADTLRYIDDRDDVDGGPWGIMMISPKHDTLIMSKSTWAFADSEPVNGWWTTDSFREADRQAKRHLEVLKRHNRNTQASVIVISFD